MDRSLQPFLTPRGIVVVGASTSPDKLGYGVARNLTQSGYPGAIHFVSQKQGELFGRPLYPDLSLIQDTVDLAILILPPGATPQAIEDCGRRGIRAAIVMSSGFREVGPEGAGLEQASLEAARRRHVRLLGPNCIGTINTHLPLDTSFLQPPMPAKGHIGFISHSGAFCAAIIDWARQEGLGFSQIISLGNQADVNETDVLAALGEDENTSVIVLYMEGVSDGRRFVEVARRTSQHKPVLALKVGRFESGQKAAASHTGALAASDTAFEAAFDKAGVLRANSAEQLFDWARALTDCPLPRGRNFAVLTNAGGPGVIAADALEQNGLHLAPLRELTLAALAARLPSAASIQNPVDMLASASPQLYGSCLEILLDDDHVHGVLIILPPPPMFEAEAIARQIIEVVGKTGRMKPIVVALMGSMLVENAHLLLQASQIPTYPFPERAASSLAALARWAEVLDRGLWTLNDEKPRVIPTQWSAVDQLMAAYQIPAAPNRLAGSVEEATAIAQEMGYPVVMKIASSDIIHKSDVGGVALNIRDAHSLRSVYTQIMESVKAARPAARIDGVHLQPQIPDGQEAIVGAVRDPQFGPLMMFGSGGVEVEGLKDVAFALAPLSRAEALAMIRRTWAGKKLRGFRNIPPADEQAAAEVMMNLSRLMSKQEAIQEIEINPLRVLVKGAVAVDVRLH